MVALSLVVLALLCLHGCATNDELQALKFSMNESVNSLRATMNTSLDANRQSTNSQLKQFEEAKKHSDEQYAADIARLSALEEQVTIGLTAMQRRLKEQENALSRISVEVREAKRELADFSGALQGRETALAALLEAEETVHREGIRHVQRIRNELFSADRVKRHDGQLPEETYFERDRRQNIP